MHCGMVVQFTFVTYGRKDTAVQKCRSVLDHERLIRIAPENFPI